MQEELKSDILLPEEESTEAENSPKVRTMSFWQILLTWVCRLAVGATFVFSGIVKGIDPWGTLYKVEEYLGVMGFDWIDPSVVLTGVFLLFTLEFLTGIFLLTGSFRRFSPIMVLLFMLVMLPLTLWIAIKDPVADCGCFGDAWVISNWATFWKNVAITAGGVWLLKFNRHTHWLITPALQWVNFIASGVYVVIIGLSGYVLQPIIDFREYKLGGPLVTVDSDAGTPSFEFVYEKNGEKKTFAETDELPDEEEGWTFVERKELPPVKSDSVQQRPLRVFDPASGEDVTPDIMGEKGRAQLALLIPSLKDVGIASTWKINSLKDWAEAHEIEFFAITSGSEDEVAAWSDLSLADYPIYNADDTAIKEVARGNPAVVYISDGVIRWKSTLRALRGDDFMAEDTTSDAMQLYRDVSDEVKSLSAVYICLLGVLIMLSYVQKLFRPRKRRLKLPRFRLRKASSAPDSSADNAAVSDDDTVRLEE